MELKWKVLTLVHVNTAVCQAGWIRLGRHGPGLQWKGKHSPPFFSERYGYKTFYPIGFGWRCAFLEGGGVGRGVRFLCKIGLHSRGYLILRFKCYYCKKMHPRYKYVGNNTWRRK